MVRIKKMNAMQISIFIYIFAMFFSYSSGEMIIKISRVLLFTAWVVTSFMNGIIVKRKYNAYYAWAFAFLLYHLFIIQTKAILPSNAFSFWMTVFYTLFINGIILWYLIKDKEFVFSIMKYIPIFTLIGGLRVFLTYGFTYYFDSRGEEINANGIGFKLALGALIAFYLYIREDKKTIYRYLLAFLLVSNVILAILTASRKVFLILFVPIILFIIIRSSNPLKLIRNILIGCTLAYIVYLALYNVPFLYDLVGYRIESMLNGFMGGETDASTSTRLRLIEQGIDWFMENPVWGYGLNGYSVINGGGQAGVAFYAHNNFIEMLVDGGIIGFVIYYSLYVYIIVSGIKNKFWKNPTSIYFISIFIASVISEYGKVTYYSMAEQFVTMLCLYFVFYNRYFDVDEKCYENYRENQKPYFLGIQ